MADGSAYYNEIDHDAAEMLRAYIAAGLIAPGDVDERSIEDVKPGDLRGYRQCHFFAGIGGWSLALRLAGWPDDKPIWTGSCPCQPFSQAGAGAGFADERHLWPAWQHLMQQCRPAIVTGEQVASRDADSWLDLVHDDLEGMGYAFGAVPFPSAGVGSPHIRDRIYWLGYASSEGLPECERIGGISLGEIRAVEREAAQRAGVCTVGGLAHGDRDGSCAREPATTTARHWNSSGADGCAVRLAAPDCGHTGEEREQRGGEQRQQPQDGGIVGLADANGQTRGQRPRESVCRNRDGSVRAGKAELGRCSSDFGPSASDGFWRAADWLFCRDGRWRPVEPGTFPLAHGLPRSMGALGPELAELAHVAGLSRQSLAAAKRFRVRQLRGYGNAINPWQAAEFVRAAIASIASVGPAVAVAA